MNKELIVKNAKKHFDGDLLEKVLKLIDTYFEVLNSEHATISNYNVGDDVVLTNNHLLHGIGMHEDVIDIIAKRGVVSLDFLDDNSNHAFCYVSAFWKVKEEIELGKQLKENAVFNDNFTMEENFHFVDEKSKAKFENGFINDFFERAEYIIFGIPSNFIEGVLVGRKYENDKSKLEQIKKILPNTYICNLDGKVICN